MGDLILPEKTKPEKLIKSKKRVKQFGEVFTPEFIVKQMCDLCEPEISHIDGKIFEPTCGNGNFLVEILRRKLAKIKFKNQKQFEFEIILALSNIYAVDIQKDNVLEARNRLRSIITKFVSSQKDEKARKSSIYFLKNIEFILARTILVGNTLSSNHKEKKLIFYDFKLNRKTWKFKYSRHSLSKIEEDFANSGEANFEDLIEKIDAFEKRPKTSTEKAKKKPPAEPEVIRNEQQTSLFNELEQKNE